MENEKSETKIWEVFTEDGKIIATITHEVCRAEDAHITTDWKKTRSSSEMVLGYSVSINDLHGYNSHLRMHALLPTFAVCLWWIADRWHLDESDLQYRPLTCIADEPDYDESGGATQWNVFLGTQIIGIVTKTGNQFSARAENLLEKFDTLETAVQEIFSHFKRTNLHVSPV